MIQKGDKIPSVPVKRVDRDGVSDVDSAELLGEGRVVFFTVPGAFTPTCHVNHLPGYVAEAAKLRAAGVDRIVCGAVNDHHVVRAWAEVSGAALDEMVFMSDGLGAFCRAIGFENDLTASGMGVRFKRAALIVDNGIVTDVFVEDKSGQVTVSGAPAVLAALQSGA